MSLFSQTLALLLHTSQRRGVTGGFGGFSPDITHARQPRQMIPRTHPGLPSSPPEEWLIRRVVSERDGLAQLRSTIIAMESEPTSWLAPSREVYLQRLGRLGEDLGQAIDATGAQALRL